MSGRAPPTGRRAGRRALSTTENSYTGLGTCTKQSYKRGEGTHTERAREHESQIARTIATSRATICHGCASSCAEVLAAKVMVLNAGKRPHLTRRPFSLCGTRNRNKISPVCTARPLNPPQDIHAHRPFAHCWCPHFHPGAKLAQGDFSALGKIVALGYDPPLSADGKQQLEDASIRLATFAADRGIDLIVHSPLQRAAATARSLFSNSGLTMVVKPELQEAGVLENFMPSLMDSRIQSLCQWLDERDEKVIALVGHGQYFKRLQRAGEVQPNVSVIECKYTRGDCICRPIAVPFEGYGMPD